MALADAGQSEREDVCRTVDEVASREIAQLLRERTRQARVVERVEGLAGRQLRTAQQALDATLATIASFELEDFEQQRQRVVLNERCRRRTRSSS